MVAAPSSPSPPPSNLFLLLSSGWSTYELRDLFHHSQWYRMRSCDLLAVPEADTPTLLPSISLDGPGSASYVPYANYDSSYLHWCTDGRQVSVWVFFSNFFLEALYSPSSSLS